MQQKHSNTARTHTVHHALGTALVVGSSLLLSSCASNTAEPNITQHRYQVTNGQDLPWGIQGDDVSARFTGQVFFKALINYKAQYPFQQTNLITFAPSARSAWHNHGPMYLIGIGGVGYYQEEGKNAVEIKPGDVVFCPPDVRHWHGAAPDSWFAQVVIYDSTYQPQTPWPESTVVTNEMYQEAITTAITASQEQDDVK